MQARDVYRELFETLDRFLAEQMAGLDDGLLRRRPAPELNPAGFIWFHLLRVWDLDLNVLARQQAPERDAWHRGGHGTQMGYEPLGHGARGAGLGFGYHDHEVDEVPYRGDVLRDYQRQLAAETRDFLQDAQDADLAREIIFLGSATTVGSRLSHAVTHAWNHVGELRMTKGLLGIPDPTRPPRP